MKRLMVASLFFALPAASYGQQPPPPPVVQAYQSFAHQAVEREVAAYAEIVTLRTKIEALEKELASRPKAP